MKTKHLFTIIMMASLALASCKETKKPTDEQEPKNRTQLVKVNGLQVAFDFMEMSYHKKMMKMMKVKMNHLENATHGLMVTIMDDKTKDIIKDAQVTLSVIYPGGNQENSATEVMSGSGMHHYAIHLKASEKGVYKISAHILYKGQSYQADTDFKSE